MLNRYKYKLYSNHREAFLNYDYFKFDLNYLLLDISPTNDNHSCFNF